MEKLPFRIKAIYGFGAMGMNLCDMVLLQWLFYRYAPPDAASALISSTTLGKIMLGTRIAECFYNIFVGHWSDNLRSKWGRRIPFLRFGIIPLATVFFLLFMPPSGWTPWMTGVYVGVFANLYLFFYAVVVTPYLSLLPELTPNLDERVALTISQSLFILVGSMIFSVMGTILHAGGWVTVAGLVAFVTIAALMPTAFTIRENPRFANADERKTPLFESMRLTLINPAFLFIAISTSFYWYSLQMIIAMLPYWVKDALGRGEGSVTLVMIPFLVMNIVGFALFNALTKRFGKYPMFLFTLLASGVCFLLFCAIGRVSLGTEFAQTIVATGLLGIPVAGFMVIPFALLADAVDFDEQRTGQRREAMFFSMQGVFQKTALGLSAMTFGQLIFLGGGERATRTGLNLICLCAAGGCLLAFLVFLKYPLRERDGKVCLAKGGN